MFVNVSPSEYNADETANSLTARTAGTVIQLVDDDVRFELELTRRLSYSTETR